MERFPNGAFPDRTLDLLRRLRVRLRGAFVAIAKAQVYASTLRTLRVIRLSAADTKGILMASAWG